MKNAMKKLLSLVLVAMLLVSVVPMGAMAAEDDAAVYGASAQVPVEVVINDVYTTTKTLTINGWEPVAINEKLAKSLIDNWDNRSFVRWENSNGEVLDSKATLECGAWLDEQLAKGYTLKLYLKEVTPAPNSKTVNVYVYCGNEQISTETMTVSVGGVTLNANTMPIPGYKFAKWSTANADNVTDSYYTLNDCPDHLYLYVTKDGSGSGNGSTGDSENKKFDYCIRWYYFDSEYITEEYGTVSANGTVKLNKYTNIDRVKVDGNAEKISDNEVKITGNQAVVDVFLTTNNPNGSTGGNPGGSTDNNKYTYNVRIYDKNGDLLKDRGWFDADANSTVYLDVNNFEYYTVNGSDTKNYTREVKISSDNMVIRVYTAEGTGSTSEQYTVYFNDADNNVVYSAKVNKGEVIGSKIAEAARDEVKNDKKGYTFEGWRLNGAGNILSTDTIAHTTVKSSLSYYPVYSKNGSDSDKLNSNKVYLHIFLDNKVSPPARDVNITDTIAKDGVVTMGEVQDVVKKYYSAKNDDGIKYDGMYMATGSWVGEFVRDDKIDRIDNIDELKKDGYVHINVMVNNAKAKSSSNADSSNPKTGDDIYMTVTVMGLSAAALCAVYFVSKKRAVR